MEDISAKWGIYSAECQSRRLVATALMATKVFFGAFLWQGFGTASGLSEHSVGYYFITGAGIGVGTVVGHVLTMYSTKFGRFHQLKELERAFIIGCAGFLGPGTTWQRIVNDAADWGWSYTALFFYMWILSSLLFLASITVFKALASLLHENFVHNLHILPKQLYFDAFLAVSMGLGDAFFTGTCATDFSDNWLKGAFGVHSSTGPFLSMIYAGTSTTVGFLLSQLVQNVTLINTWPDEEEREDDYYISHYSERQPLDIPRRSDE